MGTRQNSLKKIAANTVVTLFIALLVLPEVIAAPTTINHCAVSPQAAYAALVQQQQQANKQTTLININTADVATLMQLQGIGVKKAQQIVAYRKQHGAFTSIEALTNVNGIGEKTLANIRHRLTVL